MPAPVPLDWYDTPLYYDIIFDEDTTLEADFLERMHERHGDGVRQNRSVLELACGSGRLMKELGTRGWKTAGFDANAAMLDFANKRMDSANLRPELWQDRMESFAVPRKQRFDLIHCLVSTFKYLLSERDALSSLNRVADTLKPGGLFVLGIHLTDYRHPKITHERWVVARDGVEVVCNTRTWPVDPGSRIEAMRSRLKVTLPGGDIHRQETLWNVRSYSADQLRRLVAKVPSLNLVACHDFRHDPEDHRKLDDSYSDIVLVLKRR